MALHADDAADRVQQLLALTERLTGLLGQDLADMEARQPQSLARAEELGRLANMYRHESARVRRDPQLIAGAPAPLRAELRRATEAFETMLARHSRAIGAAKQLTEGLVRAIAEELAAGQAGPSAYGPGVPDRPSRPIALNKRA
jgi:hypothetical protein